MENNKIVKSLNKNVNSHDLVNGVRVTSYMSWESLKPLLEGAVKDKIKGVIADEEGLQIIFE